MEKETHLSEAKRKLLEQMRRAGGTAPGDAAFKTQIRDNPVPTSPAQEQVWRIDQFAGKITPLHNESITIHRVGSCDRQIVTRCIQEIVRRHEIWRTTYEEVAGQPV